jgi:flagellar export protein FliJ
MRFSYRFQTLLNWKKRLEELSQMQLAGKMEELKKQEEEIERIRRLRTDSDRRLAEELTKGIETGVYLLHKEFGEDRFNDLLRKEGEKRLTLREIEEVREELIGFMRETKILDRVKEKDLRKFTDQMEKSDQKKIDEMVVMRRSLSGTTR